MHSVICTLYKYYSFHCVKPGLTVELVLQNVTTLLYKKERAVLNGTNSKGSSCIFFP